MGGEVGVMVGFGVGVLVGVRVGVIVGVTGVDVGAGVGVVSSNKLADRLASRPQAASSKATKITKTTRLLIGPPRTNVIVLGNSGIIPRLLFFANPACILSKISYNHSIMENPYPSGGPRQVKWRGVVFLAAGLLFAGWLLNTPPGLFGKLDAIGYAVCHRIDIRSFHIDHYQLPLCSRCSGMFLGAVVGLVFQSIFARRRAGMPPWYLWIGFGILAAAFAIDGVNSYLTLFQGAPSLYEPHNHLRLITGTGMGFAIAAALYPAFNQTVWKNYDNRPAFAGWAPFIALLGLGILLDLLVITENPLILYPLALVSSAGVLILLVLIYSMVWIMLFKLDNSFQNVSQLTFPLMGGFFLAMLQIALFNLVRFYLTGTWGGFVIG
jgi:uncharacterized membrane protein